MKTMLNREIVTVWLRRLLALMAAVAAFAHPVRAAADEPFPGPRIGRAYEQAPRVLAAQPPVAQPKSPLPKGGTLTLQVGPKPKGKPEPPGSSNIPKDSDYKPGTIRSMDVDITEKPSGTDPESRMIQYSPADIARDDPIHFSSQPLLLTQLNGAFIDQRLSGPVAPFCFLPTYFEDDSLTRFGYSHGEHVQPVLSATQFYVSVLMLPYQMQKRHPWDPVCPNYIPPPLTFKGKAEKFYQEITLDAVAAEAGAVAAVFLLFP